MNKLLVKLSMTAAVGGLLCASPALAQMLPPATKAASVAIVQQPTLESAYDDIAFVRWTATTPTGSPEHFAMVIYGKSPSALTETAKSHIRINPGHPDTMFRVRINHLEPHTTYYYKVTSMEANGKSDGVESDVNQFTTPPPGERIMHYPQPQG